MNYSQTITESRAKWPTGRSYAAEARMETVQNKWGYVGVGTKGSDCEPSDWTHDGEEQTGSWLQSAGILWTGCWTLVVVSTRRFRDLLSNGSISRLEAWKLSALYYVHCPPKCSGATSGGWGGGLLTNPLDLQHVNTLTTRSPFRHHLFQPPSSCSP